MRLKAKPFSHAKYDALRHRNESLALLWGVGHLVFLLFLVLALVGPIGVAMAAMINPDVPKDRAWSAATACVVGSLLISSIGLAFKFYARRKGGV